jgi:hypothetical protein
MSSGDDIQRVRDYYSSLSDNELIRASTGDASGLTPEAMEIVKEEISKRGLGESVIKGMQAQNRPIEKEEMDEYIAYVREQPCPSCGNNHDKLNGAIVSKVSSYVIFTQDRRTVVVACPSCIRKAQKGALTHSLLFGWWGIPWGIVRTVRSILVNTKHKGYIREGAPTPTLRHFVTVNIGSLVHQKSRNEDLASLISTRP